MRRLLRLFHGGNRGSNPLGDANKSSTYVESFRSNAALGLIRSTPALPLRSNASREAAGCASASPRSERLFSLRPSAHLTDALAGISWFNMLSRPERPH